jgi:transcriptional regulator with XRE-family HTH domain
MEKTLTQEIASTKEGKRLLQQERAILEVTELICAIMDESGVSKTELAGRLGKSKGYISQILDGTANMTIRTIADVFTVLGKRLTFCAQDQFVQEAPLHFIAMEPSREWFVTPGHPYDLDALLHHGTANSQLAG